LNEEQIHRTDADGGVCLFCRLRAFFVSGEWWCENQHHDPEARRADHSVSR